MAGGQDGGGVLGTNPFGGVTVGVGGSTVGVGCGATGEGVG